MIWLITAAVIVTLICARLLRDWILFRRERAMLETIWHRHETPPADTDIE